MRFATILALMACKGPLAPGETRCTSVPAFGVMHTKCESGPPVPAPKEESGPTEAWWCLSSRDGQTGMCMREEPICQQLKAKREDDFDPCVSQSAVFCADRWCYPTRKMCEVNEQDAGRTPANCHFLR